MTERELARTNESQNWWACQGSGSEPRQNKYDTITVQMV